MFRSLSEPPQPHPLGGSSTYPLFCSDRFFSRPLHQHPVPSCCALNTATGACPSPFPAPSPSHVDISPSSAPHQAWQAGQLLPHCTEGLEAPSMPRGVWGPAGSCPTRWAVLSLAWPGWSVLPLIPGPGGALCAPGKCSHCGMFVSGRAGVSLGPSEFLPQPGSGPEDAVPCPDELSPESRAAVGPGVWSCICGLQPGSPGPAHGDQDWTLGLASVLSILVPRVVTRGTQAWAGPPGPSTPAAALAGDPERSAHSDTHHAPSSNQTGGPRCSPGRLSQTLPPPTRSHLPVSRLCVLLASLSHGSW